MKVCRKCKEEKPLTEFWAAKSAADGKQTYCKACAVASANEWRAANVERARVREAAWRAANPEKVKVYHAKWRAENPKKAKACSDAWKAANPEIVKARKAEYRRQVREKKRAARAAWFEANKDAITKPIKTPEEWSQ